MKTGKISETVLKRSVMQQIGKRREEVLTGAAVGEDCAVIELAEGEVFAVTTNPVFGTKLRMGMPPLYRAVNNLAAAGAEPIGAMVTVLLPEQFEEAELKERIKQLEEDAAALHMELTGGHTEVTAAVNEPVFSITGIGRMKKEGRIPAGGARPGQDVVLSKWIGIEGTVLLVKGKEKELRARFSEAFVEQARSFLQFVSVAPEAAVAAKFGVSAMHDVSESGIFSALWEFAEASGVGLEIDWKKIPVRQETIEICEVFDINPYFMPSSGALLMSAYNGHDLVRELERRGISAEVIGKTTDSRDRIVRNEEEIRYLEPPRPEYQYHLL